MAIDKLSRQDVDRLLTEGSVEARIATATKLARHFSAGELSDSQRLIAEEIFRLMVKDAEVRVRRSLAINLKESPTVPHDVAMSLAQDVEQVALPILQFSKVLTDDDLIAIVQSQDLHKQMAIAKRSEVSASVSEALVDTHARAVVESLVTNEGADIPETALQKVIDEFGDEAGVQDGLVQRARLPMAVAERLVTLVSDHLRDVLVTRHQLPDPLVADIISQSRERATMTLSAGAAPGDVEGLVRHLKAHHRLTASIMMRAACMGDMTFFEAGIAALAGLPTANAQRLIHDRGDLGFKAVYERAHLPPPLFPAFRCAVDVAHETAYDGGEEDHERYRRRMIERVLTQYEKLAEGFDSTDLEYLLARLDKISGAHFHG